MLASERAPESGLVIGGGEGATLREILRYPSIRRAVMVDIDDEVVELCKKHLPEMHQGAFEDTRSELRHEDARAYLEKTSERFDFITVDLVEPLEEGPACLLFTKEFYTLIRDRLTPGGAMTLQAGMTKLGELDFFSSIHRTLREVFPVVAATRVLSCFAPRGGSSPPPEGRSLPAGHRHRRPLIADRIKGPMAYWDGQPTSTRSPAPSTSGGHRRADARGDRRSPRDRHLGRRRAWPPTRGSHPGVGLTERRELLRTLCPTFASCPATCRRGSRPARRAPPRPWRSTRRARWLRGSARVVVLGADTIVVIDGRRWASRRTRRARAMLRRLRGREHE